MNTTISTTTANFTTTAQEYLVLINFIKIPEKKFYSYLG